MTPWIIKESGLALTLGVRAITLYPFIFCSESAPSKLLLAHESIHVDQIREFGWLNFYLDYLGQYRRLKRAGCTHRQAYHGISYELEAYAMQRERVKELARVG